MLLHVTISLLGVPHRQGEFGVVRNGNVGNDACVGTVGRKRHGVLRDAARMSFEDSLERRSAVAMG